MPRFAALLRGINVGGNNLIGMPALRECLETAGFTDVATYIQSGNVALTGAGTTNAVAEKVEQTIERTFKLPILVVVRSRPQMAKILSSAPKGFGSAPDRYNYDVLFLKEPLTSKALLEDIDLKDGVDRAHAGPGVVYFSRLKAKITSSRLNKLVGTPVYKQVTIRNWNTTTKLCTLVENRVGPADRSVRRGAAVKDV